MAHVRLKPIAGDGCFEPAFASHLLGSLGRGASSCKELQEAAASVVIESGKHPQNIERDLMRALELPLDSQDFLALLESFQGCFRILQLNVLHDTQKVVIPKSSIKEYWAHWKKFCTHHEAADDGNHSPIGLFGDDARWSLAGSKIICVLLNQILDPKTRLPSTRFLLFCLRVELSLGTSTIDPLFRAQAWSLNVSQILNVLLGCSIFK
ncbi:unnamed protein product [Cladocopium goreaui]|uniref:Uncharacterized protein n=1 Tax=Cladocopium goreaui TaxID=2562237 RepID=A0A9P1BZQ5_9DINO|nr:unnamed protein product [Cladocopium goreaui]CAI3982440.1 unnamed protein product [Cladocopium goreaui]CAI3982984.1 unnamed protein product [Cladocopium goreaui]